LQASGSRAAPFKLGIKKAAPHRRRLYPVAALDAWLSELAGRGVTEGAYSAG
jgi:hypothetical protein